MIRLSDPDPGFRLCGDGFAIMPSHRRYSEVDELLTIRAAWLNPACYWDLCSAPEEERRAFVAWLDAELDEVFRELTR